MDSTGGVRIEAPVWAEGFLACRKQMDAWIASSAEFHRRIPFLGIHDEGSFIASWLCHYQLTKDPGILDFARYLRDGFAAYAEQNLVHGFFPHGEVHHQTEIFNNFLVRLWQVSPDELTASLILDAAEHIGNWVPGVPEWYDPVQNRFLGWHIGTEKMGDGDEFEVPDHFRLMQLALCAYLICGEDRYLELSCRWTTRWANEILLLADSPPPALFADSGADQTILAYARGDQHSGPGRIGRLEPFVAAGAIDVLLDLHALTGDGLYANAARALCAPLVGELTDPDSNPPGALLQRYRAQTSDTSFDRQIAAALEAFSLEAPGEPAMILDTPSKTPVAGIGKRADMIRWAYRDGTDNLITEDSPSPSALLLGYQVTGNLRYAARAFEMAAARLSLARNSLCDGRRHGCSGRSVSAVASGHGRDAGYGNITGCFYALAHGAIKFVGQEKPAVDVSGNGSGLPAEAAALTRNSPEVPVAATVWHDGTIRTVRAQEPE